MSEENQETTPQEGDLNYYPDHVEYEDEGELSLDMLKDSPPGVKPMYPFSTLIRCAIKGSPGGKLLLEDIYYCLEKRFEYFRTVPPGWKNTIRHTLSLHPSFEKVPRPITDRGKGCYWTINEVVDPRIGVQRIRKKKERKGTRGRPAAGAADAAMWYDPTIGAVVGPARVPGQFGYTQFDAQGNPFPLQVPAQYSVFLAEDAYEPEIGPDNQPDWHAIWKNELRRLRHATIEQMRAGAAPEWYKMMAETVRTAFMPAPQNAQPAEGSQEAMNAGQEVHENINVMENTTGTMQGHVTEGLAQNIM
ncbi:hypothetical protein FRB94_000258 [Tulasnella sp. JGI-2019a]|nr:hypothetical protein FRB94_000258 [Tulasnella sp. JGI-2019a]KAG9015287.1 hypothetical protein FRB93_012986 [Tulasnella sp. JGI-2019a]KAG9039410.1 hypothetical protein FRB95_010699 [Tulasnella sp. JGI-2019a]